MFYRGGIDCSSVRIFSTMAKVAPPGSLSSASFQIGAMKGGSTVKRKTPSELRVSH